MATTSGSHPTCKRLADNSEPHLWGGVALCGAESRTGKNNWECPPVAVFSEFYFLLPVYQELRLLLVYQEPRIRVSL